MAPESRGGTFGGLRGREADGLLGSRSGCLAAIALPPPYTSEHPSMTATTSASAGNQEPEAKGRLEIESTRGANSTVSASRGPLGRLRRIAEAEAARACAALPPRLPPHRCPACAHTGAQNSWRIRRPADGRNAPVRSLPGSALRSSIRARLDRARRLRFSRSRRNVSPMDVINSALNL